MSAVTDTPPTYAPQTQLKSSVCPPSVRLGAPAPSPKAPPDFNLNAVKNKQATHHTTSQAVKGSTNVQALQAQFDAFSLS